MRLTRIYFSSILMRTDDLCKIASDSNGDLYPDVKIKENCFNFYKKKFESSGYSVKKDERNNRLIIQDNGNEFNFNISEIVSTNELVNFDYDKLLNALKDIGVVKLSSADLSDEKDIQEKIRSYNKLNYNQKKNVVRYNVDFRGFEGKDYIDIKNIGRMDNITTITRFAKSDIKEEALFEEERKFERYLSYLSNKGFVYNSKNIKKAYDAFLKDEKAGKLGISQFSKEAELEISEPLKIVPIKDNENNIIIKRIIKERSKKEDAKKIDFQNAQHIVSSNLARALYRSEKSKKSIVRKIVDADIGDILDIEKLFSAIQSISEEKIKKIEAKREEYKEVIEQKEVVISRIKKVREEHRNNINGNAIIFGKLRPVQNFKYSNSNQRAIDYDMTINHEENSLNYTNLPYNSQLRQEIFSSNDLINNISSQWKACVQNEKLKNSFIQEDIQNKRVKIILYKSRVHKFKCKKGINRTKPVEIYDEGNRINIIGQTQRNLYDNIIKIAQSRGFKTINFGRVTKPKDAEALLIACANHGITPKGNLPKSTEAWLEAKRLITLSKYNWEEFQKNRYTKIGSNQSITQSTQYKTKEKTTV